MPYKPVLVILKSFLGDSVMATPLLEGLVCQGGLEIYVLASPSVISLLEDTFPAIKFLESAKLSGVGAMFAQARRLKAIGFDIALVVNRSFRAALLARLAQIPVRVGNDTDRRGWLLTKSISWDLNQPEVKSYLDVADLAGFHLDETTPVLHPAPSLVSKTRGLLNGAVVGVQPGARHDYKRIPIEVLAQTVDALQNDYPVALLGGPEEKEFGEILKQKLAKPPIDLIGAFTLKESVAATSQLRLMIGGDTGLMHIAAATGCPTVTLFGPTFASRWGHHYPPHQVLVAKTGKMSEFSAEQVIAAARQAIRP